MPLPTASPDVCPIENVWAILKRNVGQREPNSVDELIDFIYEEWDRIPRDTIINTFYSIYDRLELLINLNGNAIPY